MKTPNTKENIQEFLDKIRDQPNEEKLTSWEIDFIESLTKQFEKKGSLSDKQFLILERIYSEKTI